MNGKILKFADSKQYLGKIARTGENGTRSLAFDCSGALDEYPNAQIIAVIQRPQGDPYTVTPDADGTIRRITLTGYDLEFNGHLQVELRFIDGDKILKSAIYTATIDDSIRGEADAPGQPVRDVLDRLDAEIKQAQAVVDDIRQKLENGEFNGSDATVTAESIQSALGYAPVKDVRVDGMSVLEDGVAAIPVYRTRDNETCIGIYPLKPNNGYTDITLINDALAINTATSSRIESRTGNTGITPLNLDMAVKAAMCDGKGAAWTAAEQKAARERMGVDKEYELIEKITLTEKVTDIGRDAEPDGTTYAFEAIAIKMNRTNTGTGSVSVFSGSQGLCWSYISPSGRYFGCEVFSQRGYWQSYRYDASNSDNAYASIIPNGDSKFLTFKKVAGEHISRFLIHSDADGFDTGTTISIYGVRA